MREKEKKSCWTRGGGGQEVGDPGGDQIGRGVAMRGGGTRGHRTATSSSSFLYVPPLEANRIYAYKSVFLYF